MPEPKSQPYGTWTSPITTEMITTQNIGLGGAIVDGDDLYWLETRPLEGGRNVLVKWQGEQEPIEITPAPFNVRSRVHEYGGKSVEIADGIIWFVNFLDQRVYRIDGAGDPLPITPKGAFRYADLQYDRTHNRLLAVREDHSGEGEAVNTLVAINSAGEGNDGEGSAGTILAEGHDFFAYPRISKDGGELAWISWDHPNMPWDSTTLWHATTDKRGLPVEASAIAGGDGISVMQPEFSEKGTITFVSDETGWWNLYEHANGDTTALCPMEAEFGRPLWSLGIGTYRHLADGRILATYQKNGRARTATLANGRLADMPIPYEQSGLPKEFRGKWVMGVASSKTLPEIVLWDEASGNSEIVKRSTEMSIDPGVIARPESIEFPTEGGKTAYAHFYPPRNESYRGPDNEKPPLIVMGHGGPTGATSDTLSLRTQYWTSRGFAVVDVNYGGSTGYGREYRDRLNGNWGITDVDDCINAALYLADQGRVDKERLAIRGGSAGGFTTLAALTFHDVFKAGASHYGIGDLMALATDTHKFESRYLDQMIGPLPEAAELYHDRSPIHFTEQLSCPVIFFQGLEDKVVPPAQAETMVAALREQGLPVAYVTFEGEGHGFRKSENIRAAMEAELSFYGRIFGFEPADDLPPLEIENL